MVSSEKTYVFYERQGYLNFTGMRKSITWLTNHVTCTIHKDGSKSYVRRRARKAVVKYLRKEKCSTEFILECAFSRNYLLDLVALKGEEEEWMYDQLFLDITRTSGSLYKTK